MERTITVAIEESMMTRQAAKIAQKMCDFNCRILLKRENVTVNAKSLMGVLSASLESGQQVTLFADGDDEKEAISCLAEMLGA